MTKFMTYIMYALCIVGAIITAVLSPIRLVAQDDNQASVRQGKVILTDTSASIDSLSVYNFLNLEQNIIDLKGNDWSDLKDALQKTDKNKFTVVHIGDSHLQADVGTGHVRELLQEKFGNGGRGLICPLKICGTNEPYSYVFTTTSTCATSRLLKRPWTTDMGFTGTAFTPQSTTFDITLSTVTTRLPEGSKFDKIRIFASIQPEITMVANEEDIIMTPCIIQNDYFTDILLSKPVVTAKISLFSLEQVTIYGASLHYGNSGVEYHTIGNNGATFATYNELQSVGFDISHFCPNLIILSFGTNEAFSKISDEEFEADIDYMIFNIKNKNPEAKILLTTPMECQKSKKTYRRRKGHKRKVKTSSFIVNDKVKRMRDVILKYADDNSIPVYDFYAVAGGKDASNKWAENGLMARDRIHNSFKGYLLYGDLFYHALTNTLNQYD